MRVSRIIEELFVEVQEKDIGVQSAPTPTSDRQLLQQALSNPRAARQAFLLREVLGPPVSLRSDTADRPS